MDRCLGQSTFQETLEIVQREYRKFEKVYQLLGVPEKVDVDLFDGAHMFSGKKAFDWIDKRL